MKYEQVKPNTIIPQLEERLLELIEALKKLNETVSKHTSDNYNLRIAQKHGHPQYYYVSKSTYPTGTYIPKNKQALAQKLAQRDYNAKAIELLQKEIKATKHYIKQSGAHQSKTPTISKIQALYSKMCPSRQKLIKPLTLSDDQYAAQWKNVTWQGLPFAPDAWIDEKKNVVGYEIPFTRYFYKYEAPKPSSQIMNEIKELEKNLAGSLSEIFGD